MPLARRLALFGFVAAVMLLAVGTGGTSFLMMDRGANIQVADDPFAERQTSGTVGDSFTVLSVDSGFADDIRLNEIKIIGGGSNVDLITDKSALRTDNEIKIRCDSEATESFTVELTGKASGVTTNIQKTVSVSCEAAPAPSPSPTNS
jgi:hypothetical protein